MTHPPDHPDVTITLDPARSDVFTYGMSTIGLLAENSDHPNAYVATHILDLYVAASAAVAMSGDGALEMAGWDKHMSHVCDGHAFAATYLIACGHPSGAGGAVDIMRAAHEVVTDLLSH